MTPKSFAVVACRLLAVWFFVQALHGFFTTMVNVFHFAYSGPPPIIGYPNPSSYAVYMSLPFVVELSASVVLWLGAFILAESATYRIEKGTLEQGRFGIAEWQAVGFSLIGLYFFLQGFNTLVSYFSAKIFLPTSYLDILFVSAEQQTWPRIAVAFAQVVSGLIVLFYAQKTIRVLDYLQRGGRDETADEIGPKAGSDAL